MDGPTLSAGCTGEGRRPIEGSVEKRLGVFLDEV